MSLQKIVEITPIPEPDFTISVDKNHNKFSNSIPYQLKVPNGSVVYLPNMLVTMHIPKRVFNTN